MKTYRVREVDQPAPAYRDVGVCEDCQHDSPLAAAQAHATWAAQRVVVEHGSTRRWEIVVGPIASGQVSVAPIPDGRYEPEFRQWASEGGAA